MSAYCTVNSLFNWSSVSFFIWLRWVLVVVCGTCTVSGGVLRETQGLSSHGAQALASWHSDFGSSSTWAPLLCPVGDLRSLARD